MEGVYPSIQGKIGKHKHKQYERQDIQEFPVGTGLLGIDMHERTSQPVYLASMIAPGGLVFHRSKAPKVTIH
jgi:hypothetical protein